MKEQGPGLTLGLDTGTTSSRALLVNSAGEVEASFTVPHEEMRMERPLWAEQDPDDWSRAGREAITGVLHKSGAAASSIRAVGLTGQMHGLVMLDSAGTVVRPALIWCDNRSQAEVNEIHGRLTLEGIVRATANPAITGFTLPKLLWVRKHQPEIFARVRHILLPKDYIRYRLTGELASDVSDASGTSMFDVPYRRWSSEVLDALDVDAALLPTVYESSEVSGTIHSEGSRATGLQKGTPVVGGAGDQAASAMGNGIVMPGNVSCTIGTSGVVFAYARRPECDPNGRVHTFCHAVRDAWHIMGVTQGAGLSLQWFRNRLAPGTEYDALTAEAAQSPQGARGLVWLPYLMGERTPHLDPHARGAWVGLTAAHTRSDLIRSILEGVCFSQRDGLEIIRSLGAEVKTVRLSGGGARSPFWAQMFADVLETPVTVLATQEGSAYGAALLAGLGSGVFESAEQMANAVIREQSRWEPREDAVKRYRKLYEIYRSLYGALRPSYEELARWEHGPSAAGT